MSSDYRELKVEMRNLNISEKSKDKILETLKFLHGEEFIHKKKSAYKDRGFRLDRQYWIDRGELVVKGKLNFVRNGPGDVDPTERINMYALNKLKKYGFHEEHCKEALHITNGDVGSAYELLMCRYFELQLPEPQPVPTNIIEERVQELDSLRSIYDGCEEIIANQLWHINLTIPYLCDVSDDKKTTKFDKRGKKPDKELCRYYFRGSCRYGDRCRFSHQTPTREKKSVTFNPEKNKFILEVRFPLGCQYPLEPPLVSFTSVTNEFPHYTCLMLTKRLLDEASRNSELLQPCVFSLIDLLTNRQEDIMLYLGGKAPLFYEPWKKLLPSDENKKNGVIEEEEVHDGNHMYRSVGDRRMTRDADFVNKIDNELCDRFREKQQNPKYLSMLDFRRSLPAFTKMHAIIDAVKCHQIVIISGETGCGKSTQVPQFLVDDWLLTRKEGEHFEIICTQPRKISAIGVSERVASERAERIGESVGYQIRLETKTSQYTRLLFCTTGILLRRLEREPLINSITHVIIDEVHERSEESDFLLFILKDMLPRRPDLKIILMSATLNSELFSGYFNGVPIIEIPGRTYPVEQFFLEDIVHMTDYRMEEYSQYSRKIGKQQSRDLENLDSECDLADIQRRNLLVPDVKNRDEYLPICQFFYRYREYPRPAVKSLYLMDVDVINNELIEATLSWIIDGDHNYRRQGSILVFLPGIGEILSLSAHLNGNPTFNNKTKFVILPLHSMLTTEEQSQVFRKMRSGTRKIVLSTNIAETSITIDDCVFVIDTGKMKEKGFDSNTNMESLEMVWVSKANALQRKGRAGRVMPGVVFHLYTKHRYEQILLPQPVPEICRVPLEQLILRVKILPCLTDKDLEQVIGGLLEPPDTKNVDGALTRLRDVGALDEQFNLTPLGRHLATLPVDARIGKLILFGAMFCALDSTLTMAAFLSHKSPFVAPLSRREEAATRKKDFHTANSDQLTTLKAYKAWMKACEKGRNASYTFANENCLSVKVLSTLIEIKIQLLEFLIDIGFIPGDIRIRHRKNDLQDKILEVTGPHLNANGENQKLLSALLCAALYPNIVQIRTPNKLYQAHISGNVPMDLNPEDIKFKTKADGYVFLHPTSVNHGVTFYPSPYLVYQEKIKTSKVFIRECTMVPVLALVLFSAGSLKVELNCGQFVVSIDEGWIMFSVESNEIAELLESIKKELLELLDQKIKEPRMNLQTHPKGKRIISTIVQLVTSG